MLSCEATLLGSQKESYKASKMGSLQGETGEITETDSAIVLPLARVSSWPWVLGVFLSKGTLGPGSQSVRPHAGGDAHGAENSSPNAPQLCLLAVLLAQQRKSRN